MATIKLTLSEVIAKRSAAQMYINMHNERTRFHYALEKFLNKTKSFNEQFVDEDNDIRIDCALTEGEKARKFVYETIPGDRPGSAPQKVLAVDPAKAKELQKRLRELERREVDIEPFFAKEVPSDLEAKWVQAFIGVIIEDEYFGIENSKRETTPLTVAE